MSSPMKSKVLSTASWLTLCSWLCGCCLFTPAANCHAASPTQQPTEQVAVPKISSGSLSVAPADELRYPEDRPAWIDAGPLLSGQVHRWPVSSSPSSTVDLSHRSLEVQLRAAAETYIETLLDSPEAPAVVKLQADWIQARLAPDRHYSGEIHVGDELLYEAAAELQFDSESRADIQSRWASHQVRQRMIGLGAMTICGTMMLLIATAGLSILARRGERRTASGLAAVGDRGAGL